MCPHTALYVSASDYVCPHTTIYVSAYYYMCVLILVHIRRESRGQELYGKATVDIEGM
jgi:hypothetical protein